jgi:IPT/TIG domain
LFSNARHISESAMHSRVCPLSSHAAQSVMRLILCLALVVILPCCGGGTAGSGGPPGPPPLPRNPVPGILSLSPNSTAAGTAGFTLTITGQNFVSGAAVQWNGSGRPTTFSSSTQLQAQISAADIATSGSVAVSVNNPFTGWRNFRTGSIHNQWF